MKIEQMSVVLTGAAGGIGSAAARALTNAGARVVLVGRNPERLAALRQALPRPAAVTMVAADVTRTEGRAAIHAAALAQGANVLINNAGLPCFGKLEALDADQIVHALETNLLAPMLLTRLLLPHLRVQPA